MSNGGNSTLIQPSSKPALARILVLGPAAAKIASALVRLKGNTEIFYADTGAMAIEILAADDFDHVLVDNLADGTLTLTIARLAQLDNVGKITVLAGPQSAEAIRVMPGIDTVLEPPFNPIQIASSLGIEVEDSRKVCDESQNLSRRADELEPTPVPQVTAEEPAQQEFTYEETEEDEDDRPAWMKFLTALVGIVPGLTPLLSVLYKHLALTILAGLFIAFVSYGVMIVYFLTSGDWSSPLQLQQGHELVAKTERERSELLVKKNLIIRQMSDLENKASEAEEAILRADSLSKIVISTIDQEIENRKTLIDVIKSEVSELRTVTKGFGSSKSRRAEKAKLNRDYNNRIISRRSYDLSALNLIQIEREVTLLRQRINDKQTQLLEAEQAIAYLLKLKKQAQDPNANIGVGATSEFIPLANQLIEVRQIRSAAKSDIQGMQQSLPGMQNSLEVLSNNLVKLEATPMHRAQENPVTVLFVPYDNIDAYQNGKSIYACAFAIFWCSDVGTAGNPIGGEIVTNHPFFGKPIRGQFVEANLTEQTAAMKEIIHVGRAPLFF